MKSILHHKTFLILAVLLFTSCQRVTLLQELGQRDAGEILVILNRNGISAEKKAVEKQQETTWEIEVNKSDEVKARELLVDHHLPRQKELGLMGVCKDAGMIPTPKTEKCRELLALKGEIINSLVTIPSVVNADVVLNIPDKEEFPDENTPPPRPTASVVIEMGPDSVQATAVTEEKIQQFVANAVSGMDMRDVAVIINRSSSPLPMDEPQPGQILVGPPDQGNTEEPPPLMPEGEWTTVGGLQLEADSAKKLKILVIVGLIIFVVLSVALILVLLKLSSVRRASKGMKPSMQPALPEKVAMDQLVAQTSQKGPGKP